MSISRGEFEEGRISPAPIILQFLRLHEDQAFTIEAIQDGLLEEMARYFDIEDLHEALRTLEDRKLISSKVLGQPETRYYIYHRSIGFLRWR